MTHTRPSTRISLAAPALVAIGLALAPVASAVGESSTTSGSGQSTATFSTISCQGTQPHGTVTITNGDVDSATFTVRVNGADVAIPNQIRVLAVSAKTVNLAFPTTASTATVYDTAGSVIGSASIPCATSSSSSSSTSSESSESSESSTSSTSTKTSTTSEETESTTSTTTTPTTAASPTSSSASSTTSTSTPSPTSSTSDASPLAAPTVDSSSGNGLRKALGMGLAGLGLIAGAVLLVREFRK